MSNEGGRDKSPHCCLARAEPSPYSRLAAPFITCIPSWGAPKGHTELLLLLPSSQLVKKNKSPHLIRSATCPIPGTANSPSPPRSPPPTFAWMALLHRVQLEAAAGQREQGWSGRASNHSQHALHFHSLTQADLIEPRFPRAQRLLTAAPDDRPTALEGFHFKLCLRDGAALRPNPAALGPHGAQPQSTNPRLQKQTPKCCSSIPKNRYEPPPLQARRGKQPSILCTPLAQGRATRKPNARTGCASPPGMLHVLQVAQPTPRLPPPPGISRSGGGERGGNKA